MPPIAELLVTVKKGGVYNPPGTVLDLTDDEAEALRGQVRILPDAVSVPVAADPLPPLDSTVTNDSANGAPANGDGASRIEEIAAAFDLVAPEDFNQNGRPKVTALADVLGYKPTQDEIDAAIAFRDEQAASA